MTYKAPTVVAGTSGQAVTDSVSITKPAAVQIGDLLVLVVATEATATDIEVPTGWTYVCSELAENAAVNLRVWYRFATHAEPASYAVTFAAAERSLYNLLIVRGANAFQVVNVLGVSQGEAVLPLPEPGVVTTRDNCLAVSVLVYDGSPRVLVQPAGWTLLDSDDGPAGTICAAIAHKVIALAGASGGGNWTATDSASDDYIALTFALEPGVMGRGHSIIYSPQQLLAKTLADCTEFRNLVMAADHAAAFARIWHESLPPPAAGARVYSLAELEAYRPYALIFTRDPDGLSTARVASSPGAWTDRGALWIRLVFATPPGLGDHPVLLDHVVKQLVGRLIRRPRDETSPFVGLMDLAGTTNESGGYSYLAADDVLFRGWFLSTTRDDPEQGDFICATLEVQWGRA